MNFKKIKQFLVYLKSQTRNLILMFFTTIISQICALLLPMLMCNLIDIGIKQHGMQQNSPLIGAVQIEDQIIGMQMNYIVKTGGMMLGISLLAAVCTIFTSKLTTKISCNISANLRKDVFHKIMSFPYAKTAEFSSSSLITRVTTDVEQVQSFLILITQMFIPPIMMIGGIVMVLMTSPSLAWIILLGGSLSAFITLKGFKSINSRAKLLQKTEDNFNLVLKEQLSGIKITRSFGNQDFELERFKKSNLEFADISLFINKITALISPALMIWGNLLTVLILFLSAQKINSYEMKVGETVAFMQYAMLVMSAFVMVSLMLSMIPKLFVSMQRVSEVLNVPEETQTADIPLPEHFASTTQLQFKNVYFKYPSNSTNTLTDINFKINLGSKIAIIGNVGSGKSTLIKLITRLYDPDEGEILLGEKSIKSFEKSSILQNICYVSGQDFLFSGTVDSNLRLGNPESTSEDMMEVLKIVQMEKFIKEKGLETTIAPAGSNLSGGQKQRLCMARGLLKKASIYLFDDTFSALDFKTEFEVRNKILSYLNSKTVFLVSQRIGTIKNLDKIIVMDEGKIVGIGNHEELYQNCHIYRNMLRVQVGD